MSNELHQHRVQFGEGETTPSLTEEQAQELQASKESRTEPKPEELILGKFKTQEDLESSYLELQKKFSNERTETTDSPVNEGREAEEESTSLPSDEGDTSEDESTEEDTELDEEASQDAPKVNVDKAFQALSEANELTEDVEKMFADAGISKEIVQQFKELSDFKATYEVNQIQEIVGGQEEYKSLMTWANDNMKQADIEVFDSIMENGTIEEMKIAVTNLKNSRGKGKEVLTDTFVKETSLSSGQSTYPNRAAMHIDMQDERYDTDPNFREMVYAKLKRSNFS